MGRIIHDAILLKFLYGTLFIIILPVCLFFWAIYLNNSVDLPVPAWEPAAIAGMASGSLLIAKGMFDLWFKGKGLPMNAFPPKKFVTRGIYSWLSHPIYIGVSLLSIGLSFWFRSGSGLYIVTPLLVLGMMSLVYGYEKAVILKTFGDQVNQHHPILSIPVSGKRRRPVITVIIFIPTTMYLWAVLYLFNSSFIKDVFTFSLFSLATLFIAFIYNEIWNVLKSFSEWVANSRHDWLFFRGRFRIINHSIFSGLAGAVAAGFLTYIIGNSLAVLLIGCCAILGAAGFAQFRWGSASLLRPFGYWGSIIGGIAGMLLVKPIFDIPIYQSVIAGILCAPFTQAIGRLRCLSQGCCHGPVTNRKLGIRVWQSQSRVVTLSELKGEYIFPTQLFSILFNVLLGILFIAIWSSQKFDVSIIIGLYLILTGIERFTEDAYRGEKQTRSVKGLLENQWIAMGAVVTGIIVTILPSTSIKVSGEFSPVLWGTAVLGGLITAFAMSMDFPKSNIKYSRLSG